MRGILTLLRVWVLSGFVSISSMGHRITERCDQTTATLTATRPDWLTNFIPANYSGHLPPPNDGCPTILYIGFFPWAFGEISIRTMTIELDMTIRIWWDDRRLRIPNTTYTKYIVLDHDEMTRLWSPVLQFRNCMHCQRLAVNPAGDKMFIAQGAIAYSFSEAPLNSTFVVWLFGNCSETTQGTASIFGTEEERTLLVLLGYSDLEFVGTLMKDQRKTTASKFHCNFDLTAYPMDTQDCFVEIESDNDPIWSVKLVDITDRINIKTMSNSSVTEFKLVKVYQRNCTKSLMSNVLSCVSYGFILERQMTYHLMLTYCPSMLIVILSWFSFWLDSDASAPRVTIGLTSLLTLATQFANAQKNLPAVSYIKAIDIWMFVCMFMVFASLLEFAIANNVARTKRLRIVIPVKSLANYRLGNPKFPVKAAKPTVKQDGGRVIIDRIAQILFPLMFVIFNLFYWGYYYFGL